MKRTFLCLLLLFSLFTTLSAQEDQAAKEELNEQYELFSWEPVAKAKQYGVTIEKYDAVRDIWTDYKELKTSETQVEILFSPGVYRVAIASYNLLGRKSKSSDWVQFKILEENIPYLNEKAFVKNNKWQAPVLYINKASDSQSQEKYTENLSKDNYINYNAPAELFGSNAILVKGRNIFSPKTEFYLVPKEVDQSDENQPNYVNWCDDRKEQKLNILYRNSKEYQVIVSYNPASLQSGYYALEVRNPGNNRAAVDILVLDNSEIQINPGKGFVVDERYNVNSIPLQKSLDCEFSIYGKGLNSAASFYLEPAEGAYSYPFESQVFRNRVELEVTGSYKEGASTAQITFTCPAQNLRTGYYNLTAQNWDGSIAKFLCLVKKPFDNDYTKNVKTVRTKFNKQREYVDVTLQDSKFDMYKTYTLVSAYDEISDSNNRVKLSLSPSKKKLVGTLEPDQLTIAEYALLIEDEYSSNVVYCKIDNTLKIAQNKMTQAEVDESFLRPVGQSKEVTLDAAAQGSIQFYDNRIEMIKRMPFFLSYLRTDMALLPESGVIIDLELDWLNFGYASLSTGTSFSIVGDQTSISAFSMLRIAFPNKYVSPYIGAGIGENLVFPEEGIKSFNDALGMFKNKDLVYGIAQAGLVLFTVLDIKYNLYFTGLLTDGKPEQTGLLAFGFAFPLRDYKFKRKVLTRNAQITQSGSLDSQKFLQADANVDTIAVFESSSISGFAGYNNLESLSIPYTVETIEENAFSDCKNLSEVTFKERVTGDELPLVIKSGAFANDTMIDTIYLPYRTSVVQAGAFANWTSGQNIILDWDKDDQTQRDLSGLDSCNAIVHYKNGDIYKGSFKTPLDDERNWVKINELNISNVSVYDENQYILGMRVRGWGFRWYKQELDSWINQTSPDQALDYIKTGEKITFMVQGDGNKYDFVLTTPDGGYFYYRFKTKEGKLTKVEIPYKRLKKYPYSTKKKLDLSEIKMFCIMPMCKEEYNEATFFNFEVK